MNEEIQALLDAGLTFTGAGMNETEEQSENFFLGLSDEL